MNKKMILFFALSGIALYFFTKKRMNNKSDSGLLFTEDDAKKAVLKIAEKYGKDLARIVEKIWRWETGHFKSQQFKQTGSAGMEVGAWKDIPKDSISGVKQWHDADKSDGIDTFYMWKDAYKFAEYLTEYILRHGGNYARWHTIDPQKQVQYRRNIASVKARFV